MARDLAAAIKFDPPLLHELLAGIDHGFCLCEVVLDEAGQPADYRFLTVNPLFEQMTGLVGAEGRTALEMVPDLERQWVEDYGRVALERVPLRFERASERMGRLFKVCAYPLGDVGQFALAFRDITAERRAEEDRERALLRAEALLKEVNHRVMNSLAMIAAIVSIKARARTEGQGRRAMERIAERVKAVADLYRALGAAQSETSVQADAYLDLVLTRLAAAVADEQGIRLEWEVVPVELPTDVAVPLGLMVNELVTNSIKYAFRGEGGHIRVTLERHGERMRLVVDDNGHGYEKEHEANGIGRKLVTAFARQLDGMVSVQSSAAGTTASLEFPLPAVPE